MAKLLLDTDRRLVTERTKGQEAITFIQEGTKVVIKPARDLGRGLLRIGITEGNLFAVVLVRMSPNPILRVQVTLNKPPSECLHLNTNCDGNIKSWMEREGLL